MDNGYPGMYFEQFQVGMEEVYAEFEVLQSHIDLFIEATGDANPLHTDPAFCAENLY